MRPLALLVLIELLVIALLASLWLGSRPTVAGSESPRTIEAATDRNAAPAVGELGAAEDATPLRTNERREAKPAAPAAREFRTNDPIGIVVSGSVRSTDGKPVEGASVYLRRESEYHGGDTRQNGAYAAAGLRPGDWQLTCRAEGFGQHEMTCTLDAQAFQQIDVELKPAYVVKIKIQTPTGEFLLDLLTKVNWSAEPSVVATKEPLRGNLPITESTMVFRLGIAEWYSVSGRSLQADKKLKQEGYAGELRLSQEPPVFASLLLRHVLLQSQRVEPGQHEVTFTLEAKDVAAVFGTVRARLIDGATGQPLANQGVSLETAQGGGSHAKTDAEGMAVIENALPGLGVLQLMVPERESLWLYVRVPSGGSIDLGDIVLSPVIKIIGKVVDADGKPVAEANLDWTELDRRTWPQPLVTRRGGSVEADGTFTLWGSGKHRYVVFARTRDRGFGYATVDATGGAPPGFTIRLAKRTRITYRTHFDLTVGYNVTALDEDRSPVSVDWLGSDFRPEGTALPPGKYTIEIHDAADGLVRSFPLQVGAEPLTIDVP